MRRFAATIAGIVCLSQTALPGEDSFGVACWVWHRKAPLRTDEAAALVSANVSRLFWHVGDLRRSGDGWVGDEPLRRLPKVGALEIVPVIRLEASAQPASDPTAFPELAELLRAYARETGAGAIQIDYDCPDRLLENYAALLTRCRAAIAPARLCATALAAWPGVEGFDALAASVDALFPMFYDMDEDTPEEARAGEFARIADRESLLRSIYEWRRCRAPWWAGLPCFARVSVFKASGALVGHLGAWDWDELVFSPAIRPRDDGGDGVAACDVERPGRIGSTALRVGEIVVLRLPDPVILVGAVACAREAGASGIAWFRLPDGSSQSVLGIQALAGISRQRVPAIALGLAFDERNRLILRNAGPGDLPPRVAGRWGAGDRGRQLEIEAREGSRFADATAGEFVQVAGHRNPDAPEPERVPIGEAERLTFWFSLLPANGSLRTGVVEFNSRERATRRLRWRVDGGEWQPLESY